MATNQEGQCTKCFDFYEAPMLNGLTGPVTLVCGSCGHPHRRCAKNGRIVEEGRYNSGEPIEEIILPKSAMYKESKLGKLREKFDARDGIELKEEDKARNVVMSELWLDYHGPGADHGMD